MAEIEVRLNTDNSCGAKIMEVLISTNSLLLRSLAYRCPVRNVLLEGIPTEKINNSASVLCIYVKKKYV
jgi:hypothetical protein